MNTKFHELKHVKGRGAFENDRRLKILNGHEKAKEGTSLGDTTTNLLSFSSRICLVPAEDHENTNLEAPGPKSQ